MDLPLQPVRVASPIQATPPTPIVPDDDDGDDPRDTPPPTFYGEEIDSETDTIFYVIDTSGSMGWDPANYATLDGGTAFGPRIERAKTELIRSILGLSDNFKFNVVQYSCNNSTWRSAMAEATDANKQSAQAWVMALQASGATGTGPATAIALNEQGNKLVVLLTDGAPNCGAPNSLSGGYSGWGSDGGTTAHRRVIRNANAHGATINVFGIAASGSYRAFCQGVASDSGGSYFDIP